MNLSFSNLKTAISLAFLVIFISCEFNFSYNSGDKSKPNDIAEKLSTKGNGLECEELVLSDGFKEIKSSSITYGEKIVFNFNDMKGFIKESDSIFPGLQILVLNKKKDTMLYEADLYINSKGVEASNPHLFTSVVMADPIHSESEYDILVKIWDKKGSGTFEASFDVSLNSNKKINIENNDFKFKEAYLFSQKREKVIVNNEVVLNENIHFIFEGLDGFKRNNGKISVGASIEVRNYLGITLFEEKDVFKDFPEIESSELKKGFAPYIFFTEKEDEGPLKLFCKIKIWDKKTNRSLKASTTLLLVDRIE